MNKGKSVILTISFILAELILYLLIFTVKSLSAHASFSLVALAFFFSLIYLRKNNFVVQIALFFTLISDVFLVLLTPLTHLNQSIAMTTFSVVQIAYAFLILKESKKVQTKINIIVRVVLVAIVEIITILVLKEKLDYLSVISMFYYANLVLNVVFALINYKKFPLLTIGVVLFLLCDTVIGLQFVFNMFGVTNGVFYNIVYAPFNLAWVFYGPSQALLSLSSQKELNKKAS
ncbi:MAG: hypothetical protein E7342_04465 [Clostridiales bacterium]|nr:hypothetical protein [Clostridiales bacterium]